MALAATISPAAKKPAISEENLAELQTVQKVFIQGTSEAADKLRNGLETYTCLKLTNNKTKADALIEVDEQERRQDSVILGGQNRVSSSVTITMPNGDQVWSSSKSGGDGFVNSGAGHADVNILRALAKDACPGWVLRNEGSKGTPFHKDYVRPEGTTAATPDKKQ
jgi:hypothetical protein